MSRNPERRGPTFSILSALVSALIASTVAACGYQFRVEGAGPTIGGPSVTASQEPPPRLIIRPLLNNSFEPNVEARYTNYLREEFSAGSGAQVVPDSEAADLVLTGQILSVIVPTLSFSSTATLESRTEVVVMARVEDVRSRKVVWSQVVKGASEFFVTPDLQFNRSLQNRAIEQAGRFVAADLAARFLLQLETGALTKQSSAPASVSH
ncbi:LPS assembly lipoprotein LptE [Candidatus Nitrospira nitrificans]|uniref:LPS assembly lipoprotein LptE n=1 Tax=Candidatus Nitrospira nitrificans TaxID=1742973 RepID=UPI001C3030B2|nr:LPS assembly lipoprotein LptE [Candidatus Nitrospira nitrificans]